MRKEEMKKEEEGTGSGPPFSGHFSLSSFFFFSLPSTQMEVKAKLSYSLL